MRYVLAILIAMALVFAPATGAVAKVGGSAMQDCAGKTISHCPCKHGSATCAKAECAPACGQVMGLMASVAVVLHTTDRAVVKAEPSAFEANAPGFEPPIPRS